MSRCVLYNSCEERKDIGDSIYMYVEGRYLNSDRKSFGEATAAIKILYFQGICQQGFDALTDALVALTQH